jgi:hypothetical protein
MVELVKKIKMIVAGIGVLGFKRHFYYIAGGTETWLHTNIMLYGYIIDLSNFDYSKITIVFRLITGNTGGTLG